MKLLLILASVLILSIIGIQESFADEYISPKKQLNSGVPIDQIQCRDGKIFVLTVSERPMCLTSESASKIMKKVDWTIMKTAIPTPTESKSLKKPPLERGSMEDPFSIYEERRVSLDELSSVGEDVSITTTYAKSPTMINIQDGLPQGFEVKAVYHVTPGNLMTSTEYVILPTDVEFSTDMMSSEIYRYGGMFMWYSSGTTNGMTISIDDFNQDRPYLTYKKTSDYDILIRDDYTPSVRISAVAANGMDYIKIIANDSTALDLENIVKYVWGINTNVQYIQHEQVTDIQSVTPVLLYSSKLNDYSTSGSSAPGVIIKYDQEVTLSKIPKLGETATLSITLTLKPEFNHFSGNSPTQKILLEDGFSFVNVDASTLGVVDKTNWISYSESLPVVMNEPTVFKAEITPTKVGDWNVYVDGGNYKQRHTFYFIVTEDETVLGEKLIKHVSTIIPEWIKADFGWWESGQIKDMKLDNSVQALIKFGILDVSIENIPQEVSPQFRQVIRDWHAGLMSDADFLVILQNWVEN